MDNEIKLEIGAKKNDKEKFAAKNREAPGSCEPGASTEGTVPGFRPYR